MLTVKGAHFQFDAEAKVLSGISVSIVDREIVALLGPSGCGKSTLLKLIANLLPRQEGVFESTNTPEFSFVFQDPSLMPWATVTENVALPLILKKEDAQDPVEQALKALEIEHLGDRYPSQISGGQKMRVSIARALAASPKLLLLDEPFAALDEILRFKMNELMLNLRDTLGIASLFVTHSIYEAAYLADRVLVMHDGRITGSVVPGLDRSKSPEEQRSSISYTNAATRISAMLAGEAV